MRILVVIPSLARGGAQRVVSLLTKEWAKKHDVTLALFDTKDPAFPVSGKVVDLGSPSRDAFPPRWIKPLWRGSRLAELIRGMDPDRVFSFMESANFPAILACRKTGTLGRLTVSVHNNPGSLRPLHRVLMRLLYGLPGRVVAVSGGIAEALKGMGVPASVIPNPVTARPSRTRGATPLRPYLLSVGRLYPQKAFERFLGAFALLPKGKLRLVIAGEGPEREKLEERIQALGLSGRALLLGAVPDPSALYRGAACFVLSSRHEGWPMVLLEAMAARCPVVSFDCDFGPREILEHGKSGLLVPEGDVPGLAAAIGKVLGDPKLRRRLAAGGLKRAKSFDSSRIAPLWLKGPTRNG